MQLRAAAAAAALLIVSATSAFADGTLTVEVTAWDPANKVLTFNDRTKVGNVTEDLGMPADVKPGDKLVIVYEGGEDGIDRIVSITRQ
ncbi:hypothetical protein ACKTEK_11075 [Tepidamorphus sp. 3E244]|uniref:hypothetical protein n=1 Tax=Tepidamorphus sp. 3E244 TaxID=3385498 RepID=UPI0038FCB36F